MDQKALDQALSRFEGFRNNLPNTISENCVKEYNGIIDAIGLAAGETHVHGFKIGDHELERKPIGGRRRSFTGRRGSLIRSPDKRCDSLRFQQQIDGLSHYLESQGYRGGNRSTLPTKTTHSVHVEHMYGSAIQQGTTGSQITINFDVKSADFKSLVRDIRDKIPSLNLDATSTNQLYSDVGTIEVQIASPAPKPSIISDSLSSIRAILENAAGNVIASGIIYAIAKFLSGHP
jgi:hypothetical protein